MNRTKDFFFGKIEKKKQKKIRHEFFWKKIQTTK
jgi:hypothetical protein